VAPGGAARDHAADLIQVGDEHRIVIIMEPNAAAGAVLSNTGSQRPVGM
jgi:hypothetical protein